MLSHELAKIARNLDRKLNELQKSVIEIRMVPVGQIYSKLSRDGAQGGPRAEQGDRAGVCAGRIRSSTR